MGTFKDITGQRFGKLIAIKRQSDGPLGKWVFKCDCGKEKLISKQNVSQGKVKSCGCLNKELIINRNTKHSLGFEGTKFGRLTALKHEKIKRSSFYICKCDCGKQIMVLASYLKSGHTKSCGCLKIYRHPKSEVGLRQLYHGYIFRSKRYPQKCDISLEKFKELTQKNCFYCGSTPTKIQKSKNQHSEYIYNGLDRIDSQLGYTINNVVPCCICCNRMKLNYPQQDFKKNIEKIYKHWIADK